MFKTIKFLCYAIPYNNSLYTLLENMFVFRGTAGVQTSNLLGIYMPVNADIIFPFLTYLIPCDFIYERHCFALNSFYFISKAEYNQTSNWLWC